MRITGLNADDDYTTNISTNDATDTTDTTAKIYTNDTTDTTTNTITATNANERERVRRATLPWL